MQQNDLKTVAQLFEKAGAGDTGSGKDDFWERRFEEFVDNAMAEHAARLKQVSGSGAGEKREVWRARQALYGIVEERLDARFKELDADAAEASRQLRDTQAKIFQEVLAGSGSGVGLGGGMPMTPANSTSGIAAFAAARRAASDSNSSIGRTSVTSRERRGASPSRSAAMTGLTDLIGFDDMTEASVSPSTTIRPAFDKVWGTSNTTMRGGPASLGAGPQEAGLTKPHAVDIHSYSSMHQRSLYLKGNSLPKDHAVTRPGKSLSLRQIRDIMNAVYASKAQYDIKCQEQRERTETMEQHLYSFLGKRYGLKSVIQEWSTSIFRAIQKFAPTESDVAVFGKILQNTLAESFPSVQDQLRQTVQQLLRSQLEDRHPHRPQAEIEALWRARSRCGVPLPECEEVVRYMYNDVDSDEIVLRLRYAAANAPQDSDPLTPDAVRLKDIMQILLSFQMSLTEAFLSDFVNIFRQVDMNNDGVLGFDALEDLVRQVGTVKDVEPGTPAGTVLMEAQATTYTVVRRFKQGGTFSQCVDIFTGLISARHGAIARS